MVVQRRREDSIRILTQPTILKKTDLRLQKTNSLGGRKSEIKSKFLETAIMETEIPEELPKTSCKITHFAKYIFLNHLQKPHSFNRIRRSKS
jgi:hypothetical protein